MHETAYTQPALFAVEYALAQLWEGWGIRPAALLGHSVGEYVAACLAGVFSVEDGLKLIATRGRLMQALPAQGEMVAVFADEERVRAALAGVEGEVAVAAVNGPQHTVTSGRREVLAAALAPLAAAGVKLQRLNVSHAFHSPLMEPILADFRRVAGEISYRQPLIPIVSNLSGRISDSSMASKEYWTDHILQPVLFASGMKALSREGCSAFLEIGPNPVLLGMGRQCLADNQGWWLPSLRQGQPDWRQMLLALARLYVEGSSVTWKQFDQHCAPQRITQPTYPFQRKVFWVEEPETEQTPASSRNGSGTGPRAHPLLGYQIRLAGARELRFESRIGPSHPAFLDHHRIFSKAVVPLTAYLEMALAAGKVALGTQHLVLKDVVIHKALILSEAGEVILQTVLTPDVAGGYGFEIYSLDSAEPASDPGWTKHVMGCVSSGHASESPATADLAELQVEVAAAVEVEEYYRQFAERALRYGPDFQAIRRLHHAPGRSLAEISLSQKLLPEADGYLLHPVLMDACQQAAAAVLPSTAAGDTYLPVGIARLELFRATGNHFWSHARLSSGDRRAEKLLPETTIEMFDASGVGIARLEGLSVRRASADALMAGSASDFESWLYQVVWRVQPRRPRSINASPDAQPGTWLIFTDSKGLGSELAARLREVHHRVVLVEAGKTFEQVSRDCYRVDPEDAAHFHELFGKRLGASGDLRGVVHLWSLLDDDLGNPRPDLETVQRVQTLGCRSALNAVHSIDEFGGAPPALWLVTRAARAVGGKAPLNVAQAPLWRGGISSGNLRQRDSGGSKTAANLATSSRHGSSGDRGASVRAELPRRAAGAGSSPRESGTNDGGRCRRDAHGIGMRGNRGRGG